MHLSIAYSHTDNSCRNWYDKDFCDASLIFLKSGDFNLQAGQEKNCRELQTWSKDIVNHFWYTCKTADNLDEFMVCITSSLKMWRCDNKSFGFVASEVYVCFYSFDSKILNLL